MKIGNVLLLSAAVAMAIGTTGTAQERRLFGRPFCPPPCECPPGAPPSTIPDNSKPPDASLPPQTNAFNEALASAGESGTQPATSYMPGMFGDILGGCVATTVGFGGQALACMPNPGTSSGFNITENESPRPQNRFYYNYNFFGNINVDVGANTFPLPPAQLSRHVLGFEKTFLDGDASIGLRLPWLVLGGDPSYDASAVGDLSIIGKYAWINNPDTGNVLTTGLVIRTPTAGRFYFRNANGARTLVQQKIVDVNFQPFFGYVYNFAQNLFVQGFHSVTVPTSSVDVTFMSNDVGLGYWLYRNSSSSLIQGIVPTVEMHINTPFDHRQPGLVIMQDQTSLTTGVYVLFPRSTLGGAVGVPFSGLHTIEALASYQLRF
jgi:hypothetical protein